jgi:hypothetical protein
LTAAQADEIVELSQEWPNIFVSDTDSPQDFLFIPWGYSTAQVMFRLISLALNTDQLTRCERSTCVNFIEDLEEWFEVAEPDYPPSMSSKLDGLFFWGVTLQFMSRDQALIVVDRARQWSNVVDPQVVDRRCVYLHLWDYSTTRMMVDILDAASFGGDLSSEEVGVCLSQRELYQDWLEQAEPIEAEHDCWKE